MFPKYYNNSTLSTTLPTQKVATCLIPSAKSKSMWQTNLSKLNNHFWKVQVELINYRAKPIHQTFPRHQNYRDGDKLSCSRILRDGEFQLTEPWSALFVEEVQKCNTSFPRSSGKKFPEKSVQKIFEHL